MLQKCGCRRVRWLEDEAVGIEARIEEVRQKRVDARRRG
jgi:hypothetical protein